MSHLRLVASPVFLWIVMLGQPADLPDAAIEKERQERLKFLTEQLDSVRIETNADVPIVLERMDKPVLRYTNPIRSSSAGGATFLWLSDQRPLVAASISIRENKNVMWEFTSLANEKLTAFRSDSVFWAPTTANRPAEALAEAPAPSPMPALRLTQLRDMARRFRVLVEKGKWQETRLMPQPLHRWGKPDSEILDGALFCFAETTDPEALVLIEARRDASTRKYNWHFCVAKMTTPPVKVELDQKPLWESGGGYWRNPRKPEDSYMEAVIGVYDRDIK